MHIYEVLRRPIITEKGTHQSQISHEASGTRQARGGAYTFEVHPEANKAQIRQAIEELFKVKVADVCTQIVRGKVKRMGRFVGQRSNWKKAIVTLQAGNKIEFFEGV